MKKIPQIPQMPQMPDISSPSMALSAFSSILNVVKECKIVHETEETKREEIRARRDIIIKKYEQQRYVLETYLTNTFKERSMTIEGFFKALDSGIKTRNVEVIGWAMQSIVNVLQTSPLKGFNDFMRQVEDKNIDCIEI